MSRWAYSRIGNANVWTVYHDYDDGEGVIGELVSETDNCGRHILVINMESVDLSRNDAIFLGQLLDYCGQYSALPDDEMVNPPDYESTDRIPS